MMPKMWKIIFTTAPKHSEFKFNANRTDPLASEKDVDRHALKFLKISS